MAFKSMCNETNTHGKGSVLAEPLLISCYKHKQSGGYQLTFRLSSDLMKEAGFKRGDRVDVLFDPDDRMGLIKKAPNGMTLSSKKTEPVQAACKFSFLWAEGLPRPPHAVGAEQVTVTTEGIAFMFPKACFDPPLSMRDVSKHGGVNKHQQPLIN